MCGLLRFLTKARNDGKNKFAMTRKNLKLTITKK